VSSARARRPPDHPVRPFADAARRLHRTPARRHGETATQGRNGEEWYEWEERPGLGLPDDADRLSDEQIIRVNYVESKVLGELSVSLYDTARP